jgi:predicted DNA binding protein
MGLIMYPDNKTSVASIFEKSSGENDFLELRQALKTSKSVVRVNNVIRIKNSKHLHLNYVNFTGIYGDTIATILYEYRSPFFKYYFKNGVEYWSFFANSNEHFALIMEKIKELSTVKHEETEKIGINNIGASLSDILSQLLHSYMTQTQLNIISTAYRKGYYNFPHQVTISELAKMISISPSTLNQNLRISEKKIMDLLFNP